MGSFQTRLAKANLYLLKCLDGFDLIMMAEGKIIRGLPSMCRHENRLL
jgi:hypothetical protein